MNWIMIWNKFDVTQIFTAAIAMLGTMAGAYFTVHVARVKGKPDVQSALNEGFNRLIDEFQEERKVLNFRITQQDKKIEALNQRIIQQSLRIMQLQGVIQGAGVTLPPEVAG